MATLNKERSSRNTTHTSAPTGLADLQDAFQQAILAGDDGILDYLRDSTRTSRDVLLGVYRHAYTARLIEIVAADYPVLHRFIGDEAFDDMARHYIADRPSHQPNASLVSRALPDFLRQTKPYTGYPAVAELAEIECALNTAFAAPDAAVLGLGHLSRIQPDDWPRLVLTSHPSARQLVCSTNAYDIWHAINAEEAPPQTTTGATPSPLLVWREDLVPRIRPIAAEEAMLWNEMENGTTFGRLCEMAALYDDPDNAPMRVAAYVQSWITGGLLSAAEGNPTDVAVS
ncbi:MAG: putative DNA-binding domain-containing protein [Hyphomicrobiaceae bacterium]|nr:putative DNA-binding domain-containing protein [Hyphomicrobiaceae bacterium]